MDFIIQITHNFDFESLIKLFLGFILTGCIGLERTSWKKPAGFRTHALVGISAVLVVLCGEYISKIYNVSDPTRIPAQLLSGISFIGAGTILKDGFNIKGLTTASSLLAVTCIGLCIGSGFYFGGIIATIITYTVLSYSYLLTDKLDHFNSTQLIISINPETFNDSISVIENLLEQNQILIKKIDKSANEDSSEKFLNFDIKYNNKLNLNKLITSIGNLEDVNKIEELQ